MREYETMKGLAEGLRVSYSTIRRRMEEFREKYPEAFIGDGRIRRAHAETFIRFMRERGAA